VVDPSLLRQAADRGVTICFADLDGADGLWVPEERTVLVNRALPESQVADVIEHELAHVMIDDQHADLDAGKDVLAGQPPRSRRPQTVALAALSLFVVVGGVAYGVNATRGETKLDRVAPNPNGPGLTAQESGDPTPRLSPSRGPDGRIVYVTVTPAQPAPGGTGSPIALPTGLPTATPTATAPGLSPRPTAGRVTVAGPPAPQQTTSPTAVPPPPLTTDPPATVPPTSDPPTVAPTSPAEASAGAGGATSDQGGAGGTGAAGTQAADATISDATVADASVAAPPGGLVEIGTGP
jgi:hypothetical protein